MKTLFALLGLLLAASVVNAQPYSLTESYITLGCGDNTYGNVTPFPGAQSICAFTMPYAGKFFKMTISNNSLNGGSCTTAPTFEAYDNSSVVTPTQTASTTAQALGTVTTVTYTNANTFAAGDVIGVEISTVGGTCVLPMFSVSLTVAVP